MGSIVQTVEPTAWPISLDELKARLRITHSDSDAELRRYIEAATEYAQEYQWAQYCTATFVERFDRFPNEFMLQRNPVQSVTSVAYVDSGAATQTLVANTDYTVDTYRKPCRIVRAYNTTWPSTLGHINDVTVTYVAGYGSPSDIPEEIRTAVLLKASMLRGDCVSDYALAEKSIHSLLDKRTFRTWL